MTAVVNLSGALWPQLIPSAVPGPAVTAYEQRTFLSSSEAKGALGLPGDP